MLFRSDGRGGPDRVPSETPLRGLGADTVRAAASVAPLPCHVLAPVCPGSAVLEALAGLGCARVTLQLEGCPHPHRALGRLFREEKDPIQLIKTRELLAMLEAATDRCEDAAVLLETVLVKQG